MECMDGLSIMPTVSLATLVSLTMSLFSPNTLAECSMAFALSEAMLEVRRSSLLGWRGAVEVEVEGHPRIGLEPLEEEEVDEEEPWWCLW